MIAPAQTDDAKHVLVTWLANKLHTDPAALVGDTPYNIMGVLRPDGALVGAVMFNHYRPPRIEVACAGEPGWVTRADMRAVFAYPFQQLACWTILAAVSRYNNSAREFGKRLGFRELCVIPGGPARTRDMVLYCMTRPECRWLQPERMH